MNNGEVLVGVDARVRLEYTGKGIMVQFDNEACKMIRKIHPNVKHVWWVVINSGRYQKIVDNPTQMPQQWKLLHRAVRILCVG